jgi:hypothetical protein
MMGSAMLREVASKAAARVMMHRLAKARLNAVPGLNSAVTFSRGGRLATSLDSDVESFSNGPPWAAVSVEDIVTKGKAGMAEEEE